MGTSGRRRRPRKGGKRRPRERRRRLLKSLLLVVILTIMGAGAAGVYLFTKFNKLIDARLHIQPPRRTAVFSRPLTLRLGQRLSGQQLRLRLLGRGFSAIPEGRQFQGPGSFRVYPEKIAILQGESHFGVDRLVVEFSSPEEQPQRIRALLEDGHSVRSVDVEAEFLSNLFGTSRRKVRYLRFSEIPPRLVQAVLAAEDERFFSHSGLDPLGLLRAAAVNLIHLDTLQGGSTLTQQFVKNFFLTPERSFRRKFEEAFAAVLMERRFSKEKIFELYANHVYLGQIGSFAITGLGEGAAAYFGEDVEDLTVSECALLAGIIQAPNRLSPWRHPREARRRRDLVLDLMERNHFISIRDNVLARAEPLSVLPESHQEVSEAPYFVDFVKGRLSALKPDWRESNFSRLEVQSTLDPNLQRAAYAAMTEGMKAIGQRLKRRKATTLPQAALLVADPGSSEILAMLGGRDYAGSQLNRVTQALRQPGSTFKPFVYAAALETGVNPEEGKAGFTLSSHFLDEPHTFYFDEKPYAPHNAENRYFGSVTLRQALAHSLNVPSVKLAEEVGFDRVTTLARAAGLNEDLKPYPSVALGSFETSLLELAQGYLVFASAGRRLPLHAIKAIRVDDSVERRPGPSPRQVLSPEVSFLVTSALESVLNEGTGQGSRRMGFTLPAAGKTGTSRDSWFVGYTPELLCAVWVGYDDGRPLGLSGAHAALVIWTDFMKAAARLGYLSGHDFVPPPGIVSAEIDPRSGLLASSRCAEVATEYYIRGTEPRQVCRDRNIDFAQATRPQPGKEQKRKGLWGWLKGIFH